MDVGASTTFTLEAADRDIMDKPPRPARARFFDAEMIGAVAAAAISLFACVAGAAWSVRRYHGSPLPQSALTDHRTDCRADALVLHSPASGRQSVCFCAWLVGHVLLASNMRTVRQPVLSKVGRCRSQLLPSPSPSGPDPAPSLLLPCMSSA